MRFYFVYSAEETRINFQGAAVLSIARIRPPS